MADQYKQQTEKSLTSLLELSRVLVSTHNLDDFLSMAVKSAVDIAATADRGTIQLLNQKGTKLKTVAIGGVDDVLLDTIPFKANVGIAGYVMTGGKMINVADVLDDERFISSSRPLRFRALLVAPLMIKERFLGTLSLSSKQVGAFSTAHEALVQLIADQITVALENAQLFEHLEETVNERTMELKEANRQLQQENVMRRRVQKQLAQRIREMTELQAERKKLEKRLQQSQKMEAIARMAGGIAHDFNNILTVIIGYSNLLLLRKNLQQKEYKQIKEIDAAATKASNLMRQLLAVSGKEFAQSQLLNLNVEIAGMHKKLQRAIGADIDLCVNPGSPLNMIKCDPEQITLIVLNVVANAKQSMPNGGKLTIQTTNANIDQTQAAQYVNVKPGSYVKLSISDTGQGMDLQTQDRIFEPFFASKNSIDRTGLGLATVYGIISCRRGFINLESEPGKGTTLEVFFPSELQ